MLTNQTRAALVQLLQSISPNGVRLLFLKHFNIDQQYYDTDSLLQLTSSATPEEMTGLLVELVGGQTAIRADAPAKHVFDARIGELARRLRADGFEVIKDALCRLVPAAEPAAQISDYLDDALLTSGVDGDEAIRRMLGESYSSMSASPPNFNDSTTKARIALETVARRTAPLVATKRSRPAPQDSWGSALHFLKAEDVITQAEEDALAKVYTLISPGAHSPKGLTDEQWALLSRTFAISGAYFLIQQYLAA